jgi:putative transposase
LTQTTAILLVEASPLEKDLLLRTMEKVNAGCNLVSGKRVGRFKLHKLVYRKLRDFGLSSQMSIGVISKVAGAMKLRDHPEFYLHGAIPFDQRSASLRGDRLSISTIEGRTKLKVRMGKFQQEKIAGGVVKAGMKLCYRAGRFFLAVVVDTEAEEPVSSGILGVDLGIVNLATDSEGRVYTDEKVEENRVWYNQLRGRLQSVGTKNSRRHLKKLSGGERRFKRDVNHRIAKHIVASAKGTSSMVAMEELTGIRERTTVGRAQRDRHSKWAFFQLRKFVEYKAQLQGIRTVFVNPRNTSRTCPKCLWCEKANRKSRDVFQCRSCGWTAPADYVGALGIQREAAFNLPIAAPGAAAISPPSGGRS